MKKFLISIFIFSIFSLNFFCDAKTIDDEYIKQRNKIIYSNNVNTKIKLTSEEKLADKKLQVMKSDVIAKYDNDFPYDFPILFDERLTDSNLYTFCKRLPKGADLHVHGSAIMTIKNHIDLLSQNENVYISQNKNENYGKLLYIKSGEKIPSGYIKFSDAINEKIFTKESLINLWTITPYENKSQEALWNKFEYLFSTVDISHKFEKEWIYKYYYTIFKEYCENNIQHVELRKFFNDYAIEKNIALIIRQAYYDVKKDYPDFSLKLVVIGMKNKKFPFEKNIEILETAKKLQKEIKDNGYDFIIGYDLVNEEDSSRQLSEFAPLIKGYRTKDFNFYLHAGESLSLQNKNLIDAYLLKSKRVGHALNLYMYPKLEEKFKKEKIAIEFCPISNLRLGYVKDLRKHPALGYFRKGIPVVICSDDPLFLENYSLVDDWFAAIVAFDLDLADVKQLCLNSILYSGLSNDEKKKLLKNWNNKWSEFIKEVISEK